MKRPSKKNENKESPFIRGIVAGALLTGVLFFFYLGGVLVTEQSETATLSSRTPATHARKSDPVHRQAIELVNRNLQMDQKLKELRALGVEVKNEKHLRKIQKKLGEIGDSIDRDLGVEVIVDDGSIAVMKDLEEPFNQSDSELTPEEKIELSLIRDREIAAYQHEQRLQYVRQFLQNARERGYDIILNDKLEVVQINRVQDEQPYKGDKSIRELFE